MDKLQWESRGHVYWMELTEPTFPNLLAGIDKAMALGGGFHMLIAATRQGTRLLQNAPEEPLPLAEMIRITNSRLVRIWWSLNPPSEPIDLLFCCYRSNDTEDSTPPPGEIRFAPRDNWGPSPASSDDGSAGSDIGQSSDRHQPESSAAAAKRTTSSRTPRSGHTTKKTRRTHRINWAHVGKSGPESSGTQASVPRANLGTRVLRSSRQGEWETDLKKASRTPANNGGKRNLAVLHEADEPYSSDGSPEPLRKVARQVGAIDADIEVQPDTPDREHNPSRQLADRPSPTNSPSPFTPNPSHDHASAASDLAEARRSAAHLLMLAAGAEQPVNRLATQVDTPGRSHSPSDPRTGDVFADIPMVEEVGKQLSLPADSPTDSSGYSTPGKFRLRLPGFSSILLARSAAVPAEMGVGSPLKPVSVLAHLLCEQSSPAPTNVANV